MGPVRCYCCGGPHLLSQCKQWTKEQKKEIWDKHKDKHKYAYKQSTTAQANSTNQKGKAKTKKSECKQQKNEEKNAQESTLTVQGPQPEPVSEPEDAGGQRR